MTINDEQRVDDGKDEMAVLILETLVRVLVSGYGDTEFLCGKP